MPVSTGSSPELSVVCRSCGAEVSPYVTECPYCGTRLRKRAPKLERHGDELMARESRRDRRRRRAAERRAGRGRIGPATERPYVTMSAILVPSVLLVVQRAADLSPYDVGAIAGPVDGEWWRYFAAPFVYDDLGYLFVVGVALAIFLPALERRIGLIPAALLVIVCGALGMLAADGIDSAISDGYPIAAGGNGLALGVLCAWLLLRESERRADPTSEYNHVAVAVAAAVLVLLPLVEDSASVWAGTVGILVGFGFGMAATRRASPT
jgi:membrane associated rhomboid family serine protease